jgi:hypothetical protein
MSWLNDDTGRPKEDGGHKRINISADEYTRQVLDIVENKSVFIESCVRESKQVKVLSYYESKESTNHSQFFKDVAQFEYTPKFSNFRIEEMILFFSYQGEEGIEFRTCVNNIMGQTLTELPSTQYTGSHVYNCGQLGFKPFEAMVRNNDKFIFRFQFRPLNASNADVKMIHLYLHIIDSPLTDPYLQKPREKPKES